MNSGDNGENNPREISLSIAPTTGGGFEIQIFEDSNVDQLRWRVARKLQTPRDRLTFLHRDKLVQFSNFHYESIIFFSKNQEEKRSALKIHGCSYRPGPI